MLKDPVRHEQADDCAFYCVFNERGTRATEPIDSHAVYGMPTLGGRDPEDIDVPIRNYAMSRRTAIRTVRPGDLVRVNAGRWMTVLEKDDEGFVAKKDQGHVPYVVKPDNPLDNPPGTFDMPWMRDARDHSSKGGVDCLEVNWSEDAHWHPHR